MSVLPVHELMPRVAALNAPGAPYVFDIDGTTITGRWAFDDPALAEALGDGGASPHFRYVVTLDPSRGTFRCSERDAGYNNGAFRAYRGYSRNYNVNLLTIIVALARRAERKRRTGSATPPHRFRQEELKAPLRSVLEGNGWRRRGLIR
ncbi:hypothetical protein J2Y89_000225 [Curtobacterium herbarum]|uniref:hypothetical protein n=1 Tax=Curtobacterium herbarum TaxID=150122 RepID=UPI0020A02665|nr:hypothetical protein [Curtobacterium herbarum]MCP1501481.1 hypothetical protein [Curtobacterium herbarum]